MDLKKLEKLSCLKIAPEHTEALEKSLEGVIEMMQSVASFSLSADEFDTQSVKLLEQKTKATSFRTPEAASEIVSKDTTGSSLHLYESHFLAPKVIKK